MVAEAPQAGTPPRRAAYRHALLAQRVAATVEHQEQPYPRLYGTVIDVGSNRGQFAVFARHRWRTESCSASSRCLTLARSWLESLMTLGTHRYSVRAQDQAGEETMHVARSDDSSSLLPATGLQVEAFPDTAEVAEMVVDVRRLDNLIAVDEFRIRS